MKQVLPKIDLLKSLFDRTGSQSLPTSEAESQVDPLPRK